VKHEADFKRELVEGCEARGAYAIRHEDRYGLGRLDLSIKFPGLMEIKAEGKLVPHQSFAPTPRQFIEGEKYQAAGGIAVLLGWDRATRQMYIHPWAKTATKAGSFTKPDLDDAAALEEWLMRRQQGG
jgi:hypothetical protein